MLSVGGAPAELRSPECSGPTVEVRRELYDYVETKNKLPYITYTLVATYGPPVRGQMLLLAPETYANICIMLNATYSARLPVKANCRTSKLRTVWPAEVYYCPLCENENHRWGLVYYFFITKASRGAAVVTITPFPFTC